MKNSIKSQTEIMKHIKRYNEGKVPRNAGYTEIDIDDRKVVIVVTNGYSAYYFNSAEFYKVYVDEKLIKEFGKVDDLHFAGKGKHEPVYVYEGENLVGLIMPMKMPKNKD